MGIFVVVLSRNCCGPEIMSSVVLDPGRMRLGLDSTRRYQQHLAVASFLHPLPPPPRTL